MRHLRRDQRVFVKANNGDARVSTTVQKKLQLIPKPTKRLASIIRCCPNGCCRASLLSLANYLQATNELPILSSTILTVSLPMPTTLELQALLQFPAEKTTVEYKSWLDLNRNHGKATLAKAAIALANEGGGVIVLGMRKKPRRAAF